MWQGRFCILGTLIKRGKEEQSSCGKLKIRGHELSTRPRDSCFLSSVLLGDAGLGATGRHAMSAIVASLARAVWCAFDQEIVTKKALPHSV